VSTSDLLPGQSHPLGANIFDGGVNFCIFSRNCTAMELLLFDDADAAGPSRIIRLDPSRNRTFYYWHVFVPGIAAGQLYGYRAFGPFDPDEGHRFDGTKVLVDPYARAVTIGKGYDREAARGPGDNTASCLKSVVMDPRNYDWEGDKPLCRPLAESVIYEMHVAGFTRHPNSGVPEKRRGTYAGLIDKIPYLQELGVTAIELLPIQCFDPSLDPKRRDYWGYNPIAFFAPHAGYSCDSCGLGPVNEFRSMIKAMHRAGIEVILDMVFNHTSEGDANGPTLSFRGLENKAYYLLDPKTHQYANFTGCGNTVNGNHSIVRRMILDCLRYWVQIMHVDGFRFDLASVLARDEEGQPLRSPPVLWEIESDPVLAGCKLIAEAWDAAGLYQVGTFVGHRWAEWNGQYRDDIRRFVKSEPGTVRHLASRIAGSPDLYPHPDRDPHRSINFVTCHDGFTLNDLVSYDRKHNEANGENNRDGSDGNYSWNCGVEGPTERPDIDELRLRQIKNFFTVLLLSHGTPMMLMGDEVRRTQGGNNNAYAQNNDTSWFDWLAVKKHDGLFRFVQGLIRLRKGHRVFDAPRFWVEADEDRLGRPEITWDGVALHRPDFGDASHTLAFEIRSADGGSEHLYVILNAYWEPLRFALPGLPRGRCWLRVVDTHLPSPQDLAMPGEETRVEGSYEAAPRSTVVLRADEI
jgi:glycogen operon protein